MGKTKIIPKQLYENRNTSDIFQREVILGILRVLNMQLKYTLIWEDTPEGTQDVIVPFFYDFSGGSGSSEKFIQDNYLHWTDDECTSIGLKKMDGDYKPLPYGVVVLESTQIESGNISNRFVMGQFQRKVGKELKSYVSFLYSVPLTMNFNVNIGCDTINTMWKIEQAFREYFYKNRTFHFNYKGTVCSARIGFPESISETKTNTYQFGSLQTDGTPDIKLFFSLSVETYLPVFDPYSEMPADLRISSFKNGIVIQEHMNEKSKQYYGNELGVITTATLLGDVNITTEQEVLLRWSFDYKRSDLMMVDILYLEEGSDEYEIIDTVENHNCYHLQIEDNFVENNVLIDVIIPNNENCLIINLPAIKFFCDPETNIVDETTCTIVNKGFVITDRESIDAVLSYENSKHKLIEKAIKINIKNNAVDEENPVEIKDFVYTNEYNYKRIKLFVRDHNNPEIICPFLKDDEWINVF